MNKNDKMMSLANYFIWYMYYLYLCLGLCKCNMRNNNNIWLVVLRLNVPVNNFSVMSGRSHRFLGN